MGMILTPTRKRFVAEMGSGCDGREIERGRGLLGWGRRPEGRDTSHSALALDPETVVAAEARAPVPGILARILALMWLN